MREENRCIKQVQIGKLVVHIGLLSRGHHIMHGAAPETLLHYDTILLEHYAKLPVISRFAFCWNSYRSMVAILLLMIRKYLPGSFFHLSSNHLPVFTLFFELFFYIVIAFSISVLT